MNCITISSKKVFSCSKKSFHGKTFGCKNTIADLLLYYMRPQKYMNHDIPVLHTW